MKNSKYEEEVTTKFASKKVVGANGEVGDVDKMFEDALRIVVNGQKASASLLQRRLSIGYARSRKNYRPT